MRRVATVVALALAAVLGACASDSTTAPVVQASLAGTWNLTSMDGSSLPITIVQIGSDSFEIVSDVIAADSSGNFTEMTVVESMVKGQMAMDTIPDAGSWSVTGSSVALTFNSDSSTTIGNIVGTTLTLPDANGGAMVYAKQ